MAAPKRIDYLGSAEKPQGYPREDLPEIAFSGRSNVGKSSLINTLVGRKGLARISRTPGKTQRIHFFQVDSKFILVDLPGYGYAKVPEQILRRWGPMVETYLSGRKTLKLLAVLLDLRRIPNEQDLQLKEWLSLNNIPTAFILTKADKIPKGKRRQQVVQIARTLDVEPDELLVFSSHTKEGLKPLWSVISDRISLPGDEIDE